MSQELKPNPQESAALDRIETQLKSVDIRAMARAETLDLGDLCKKYHDLKPSVLILLGFIKKIPIYGAKIAAVIEFLIGLADIACPV